MVIFGASGDLTKRLVVPALYNLSRSGLLPERFALLGVDHNEADAAKWRTDLRSFLDSQVKGGGGEFEAGEIDATSWDRLGASMSYVSGDFTQAGTFERLKSELELLDRQNQLNGCVLFYLAVPDRFFGPIVDALDRAQLTGESRGWRRVVIEKPFGHDLESAKALNADLLKHLRENQIFRIDHFLGKETVQNIMALRFAMDSSSPSGIATASITCRSPSPKRSASRSADVSMKRPAHCATWCPIISFSFFR